VKLDQQQRTILGKTLLDISKLILAIDVLTPILTPEKVNNSIILGGFIFFVICLIAGVILHKQEEK